ncbi:hypothetical protein CF086_17555 [Clostridium botulinum]|uniref:hypothetical protein n=1 Tax=Clostridium botulinum TaxID=1491 RepID=UPI000773F28A|nr:hypothetical protein [Clostridium botulinum]MBN3352105.1 hypothetical protein [Clostridium botulinum]
MEKYKTYEAINMLSNNPNLIFINSEGQKLQSCSDGFLSYIGVLKIEDVWRIYEKPLTLQEVLIRSKEKDLVKLNHPSIENISYFRFYHNLREVLKIIASNEFLNDNSFSENTIKHILVEGIWYIKSEV